MKNFKVYIFSAIALLTLSSCLVEDEIATDQQNYNGSLIVGFQSAETLGNFVQETGKVFDFNVPVDVIGGAAGQPANTKITLTYEVGTLNDLGLSTEALAVYNEINDNGTPNDTSDDYRRFPLAEEGVHYNLGDTTLESIIDPNKSFDLIPLKVINDALDGAKTTLMVLNLKTVTSVDDVVIGEQLKSTLVKFQLCRTDLAGTYTAIRGYSSTSFTHTIVHLGGGNYEMNTMFGWPSNSYTSWFYACAGELIFTEWVFSNEIIQGTPGYVDPNNGNLIFEEFGIGRSSGVPIFSGRTFELAK